MVAQDYLQSVDKYSPDDLYTTLERLERLEMEQIPPDMEHKLAIYEQMNRVLEIVGED